MTLLTVEQVAQRYSVEPSTVREWARTGQIPAIKRGKAWGFTEAELARSDLAHSNSKDLPRIDIVLRRIRMQTSHQAAKIHRAKSNAREAKRRCAAVAWADQAAIEAIYRRAREISQKTGIPHEVDHIVPINGRNVCGLHVEYNLQIITESENMSKGNRW